MGYSGVMALPTRKDTAAMSERYNFNYWVCEDCAHTWASPADVEAPARCENCGWSEIVGFVELGPAEDFSQEILDDER